MRLRGGARAQVNQPRMVIWGSRLVLFFSRARLKVVQSNRPAFPPCWVRNQERIDPIEVAASHGLSRVGTFKFGLPGFGSPGFKLSPVEILEPVLRL